MNTIEIYFRDEIGRVIGGELINGYRIVECPASPVGVAIDIDQEREHELDVLVIVGNEFQAHHIYASQLVSANEVSV